VPLLSVLSNKGITKPLLESSISQKSSFSGEAHRCQNGGDKDWRQVNCMIGFYEKKISAVFLSLSRLATISLSLSVCLSLYFCLSVCLSLSFFLSLTFVEDEVNFMKNRPSLKIVLVPLEFHLVLHFFLKNVKSRFNVCPIVKKRCRTIPENNNKQNG
jgi:hypothetical protein